jgi:hypothetical protein
MNFFKEGTFNDKRRKSIAPSPYPSTNENSENIAMNDTEDYISIRNKR